MITMDMLRAVDLFAAFDDEHFARLAMRAAEVTLAPGEYLVYQGETPAFFVILEGSVALTKRIGGREQPIATRTMGHYFGEVPILLGVGSAITARATEPARVLRLGADDFRALLADLPTFARTISEEMLRRVSGGQQMAIAAPTSLLTVIADPWDPAAYRLRDFLARNKVLFDWQEPDAILRDPESDPFHDSLTARLPHVRFHDGTTLFSPTLRALAARLDLPTVPAAREYDLAIVGGGPAGLSAAVYAASEGLHTLMIERVAPGGQAGTSSRIENYLGFPAGIAGEDLGSRAWDQAVRLGADIVLAREVVALAPGAACHAITLDGGDIVRARTVLLATGVDWRLLAVPGIDQFLGRGVYYGAARTEARACRGADVYLVGAGNSAGQAAMFFADYARTVMLLVRGASLTTSMSRYLIDQLATKRNIQIETEQEVTAVDGNEHLEAITVTNRRTGAATHRRTAGLFVFIGADTRTAWLPPAVARDDKGFVLTGSDVRTHAEAHAWSLDREPYFLETSVPGLFAAGDVRSGSIKRVAAGVGEGGVAVSLIHRYLAAPL